MRRKRNADEENKPVVEETSKKVTEPPKFSDTQIKTFKERDIEILNYLDSIGENIYDPNRYGGMYLHRDKKELPDNVKKVFENEDKLKEDEELKPDFKKLFGNG